MTNISRFDVVDYLDDESKMAAFLSGSVEEGGVPLLLKAIGEVARARGMSGIAESAGLTRASLYKSLDEGGNPSLKTIVQVIDALGFTLLIEPKQKPAAKAVARTSKAVAKKPVPKRSKGEIVRPFSPGRAGHRSTKSEPNGLARLATKATAKKTGAVRGLSATKKRR